MLDELEAWVELIEDLLEDPDITTIMGSTWEDTLRKRIEASEKIIEFEKREIEDMYERSYPQKPLPTCSYCNRREKCNSDICPNKEA